MRLRTLLTDRRGTSLVELLAGLAIAALVLGVLVAMQTSTWRLFISDSQRFGARGEAATAADRLAADVRKATAISLATPGATSVQLTQGGTTVTYRLDPTTGALTRESGGSSRPLLAGVTLLAFYSEDSGRTVRMDLETTDADGRIYRLVTRATRRS